MCARPLCSGAGQAPATGAAKGLAARQAGAGLSKACWAVTCAWAGGGCLLFPAPTELSLHTFGGRATRGHRAGHRGSCHPGHPTKRGQTRPMKGGIQVVGTGARTSMAGRGEDGGPPGGRELGVRLIDEESTNLPGTGSQDRRERPWQKAPSPPRASSRPSGTLAALDAGRHRPGRASGTKAHRKEAAPQLPAWARPWGPSKSTALLVGTGGHANTWTVCASSERDSVPAEMMGSDTLLPTGQVTLPGTPWALKAFTPRMF